MISPATAVIKLRLPTSLPKGGFVHRLFYGMSIVPRRNETTVTGENTMRTFKVSDELYDQLKSFVVDPFDDTPEIVITRLVEIVNKAKGRWSPFDEDPQGSEESVEPRRKHRESHEEEPVVVL